MYRMCREVLRVQAPHAFAAKKMPPAAGSGGHSILVPLHSTLTDVCRCVWRGRSGGTGGFARGCPGGAPAAATFRRLLFGQRGFGGLFSPGFFFGGRLLRPSTFHPLLPCSFG